MSTKFKGLKNDLQDLESEVDNSGMESVSSKSGGSSKVANYILLFAFVGALLYYAGNRIGAILPNFSDNIELNIPSPFDYNEDLLTGMGEWMEDLGYGVLTNEQLADLRDDGITATETQRFHDIGYTDVTLEQLVELQDADVSATYASMMKELGYEFTVENLIETRRNGVTANFTSRMMDLGYTLEQLNKDNLIRMKSIGVTEGLAERLMDSNRVLPTIDELIRYRISNQ